MDNEEFSSQEFRLPDSFDIEMYNEILESGISSQTLESELNRAAECSADSTTEINVPSEAAMNWSLPEKSNFPGLYGFNIKFEEQKLKSKKVVWMYSSDRDKLYVTKDLPCPINFATAVKPPEEAQIRIMTIFSEPQYESAAVTRCIDHLVLDATNGISYAEHLVRCECDQAKYETNTGSERHSILVPYVKPDPGQDFSTYLFKFVCFGSCRGGLNRRPIKVIFTLEVGNKIVGRRTLDVKICSSPVRDCKNDDKLVVDQIGEAGTSNPPPKKKQKSESIYSTCIADMLQYINTSVPNDEDDEKGHYVIDCSSLEEYNFLQRISECYDLYRIVEFAQQRPNNAGNTEE